MGNIYIGNSLGTASKITNAYVGVNGISRKIKAIYVGVNGVARLVWNGGIKKLLTKYLHCNMGSNPIKLYNTYSSRQTAGSITSFKNSQLPSGFLCDVYSSYNDGTGTTYYYKSIQRFSLDNDYNLTNVGRVNYNYNWGGSRYDGSWYTSASTACDFYHELGDYLFMCLRNVSDGSNSRRYYAIRDWSGNEICSLDQASWISNSVMPTSGVAFSNSTMVVGINSYSRLCLGVINFDGANLTQAYYYPTYVDSSGNSYYLRTINNRNVSVARLENNIGIMAFQGATEQYSDLSVGGSIAVAFRLNSDGSITFGNAMYVKEGYSAQSNTTTGILLGVDKNHAVMYDHYYSSSGSGYYYYSKKWFALYIDDNLNITITHRYDFHNETGIYTDTDYPVSQIGRSATFAVSEKKDYTDTTKNYGMYLYTLDTSTNKIVLLGEKILPQSCNVPYGYSTAIHNFSALGDDKFIYPKHSATYSNATTTDLYAYVGKFE